MNSRRPAIGCGGRRLGTALILALLPGADARPAENLVANPSFETAGADGRSPDAWADAGNRSVRQELSADTGPDGRRCARLRCTEFAGSGPDVHAMLCQTGRIAVQAGRWYRLAFRARGEGIRGGSVEIALTNTRPWENTGLAEGFVADGEWKPYEFAFQATHTVPAETSRLQFWFRGTGTLWLDDVELAESAVGREWFPQIPFDGAANPVPNASFECGAAGWGSIAHGLRGWGGNLYRLAGTIDDHAAVHGRRSLRIDLDRASLPVHWFDYYDPIRDPVPNALAANLGWFRVTPGEPVTLSAWLRAAADGTPVHLAVIEAPDRRQRRTVTAGREWRRESFTVRPSQPFLFAAIGPDLDAEGARSNATVWIDAVRLDRGRTPADFAPRAPVESWLAPQADGGFFTNVAAGLTFTIETYNDGDAPAAAAGRLVLTDFFDREAAAREVRIETPARGAARRTETGLAPGRPGFYRASWIAGGATQTVRCALVEPHATGSDTFFGFNHAYPWDFLVQRAQAAGIGWWRDWSAKWQTVEPSSGRVDYAESDAQIDRVRRLGGRVEVLLPFPSAAWSSAADPARVADAAKDSAYLRDRMTVAWAARDPAGFDRYAATTAARYAAGANPVTHVQLLNEPVYTSYALPRQFGYGLDDYLRLLGSAGRAIRAAAPACRIVGGISCNLDHDLAREFVERGGLDLVDVVDLHNYDTPRPAESHEEAFRDFEALCRAHGGPKPVWITEWGCYADDDPPARPLPVGDAAMNRCRWPGEREASAHIVKYAAVAAGHGVRKIFFHAGTCGPVNGQDAGGVLFEYGGAPRKMLPAVAAFERLVGVPTGCEGVIDTDALHARVFRTRGGAVAVAWRPKNRGGPLATGAGVRAFDIMGGAVPPDADGRIPLDDSPAYLAAADPAALLSLLPAAAAACAADPLRKIGFDLDALDDDGLRGPPDGRTSLSYEFAIPDTDACKAQVRAIDPKVQFMPGSRGRIGAGPGECLCIGTTRRGHRQVLPRLVALPFVTRIIECHFE